MKNFFKFLLSYCFFFISCAQAYQAVIFDCDGVLVNTEELKFVAWQRALTEMGVQSFTLASYLPLVGYSSSHIAHHLASHYPNIVNEKALIEKKEQYYKELQLQGVPVIDEAVSFLKILIKEKPANLKIAIASSAPRREIFENLRQIGFYPEQFDLVISGEEDLAGITDPEGTNKPKPYIYQRAAQLLHVDPRHSLVFEDSQAGVEAASGAGMVVIAVPNEYTKQQDFTRAKAVKTFSQLNPKTIICDN